jgi:hypothetical protein
LRERFRVEREEPRRIERFRRDELMIDRQRPGGLVLVEIDVVLGVATMANTLIR